LKCGDADLEKGEVSTNLHKAYHSRKIKTKKPLQGLEDEESADDEEALENEEIDEDEDEALEDEDENEVFSGRIGKPLRGYANKYNALRAELNEWPKERTKILRVLVTAAVTGKKGLPERNVQKGTSFPEYFIRCGAAQTELLFGREFKTLLETVRKGGQSLSEIYDKINKGEELRKRKRTDTAGRASKKQTF
jgi:hypothetical protein